MPSYLPTPNPIVPGSGQAPYANHTTNPQGSPYAAAYGYVSTEQLRRDLAMKIFDATPKAFEAMKTILNKPVEFQNDDVFTFQEHGIGRTPIKVKTNFAGGANTGSIICVKGAASVSTMNKVLQLPSGAKCIVTGVTENAADDTIAVKAQTGALLPAVLADTIIPIQMGLIADGMNISMHYDRLDTISRTNYIQLFQRDRRWTRMEMQKYANSGTTDLFDKDKQYQTKLIFQDAFISMFVGKKGEFTITLPGGATTVAKTTDGIFTSMVDAGSWHVNTSDATLQTDFEQGAFATYYMNPGSVRYIYATSENLYKLSKVFKEDGIQYTPNDTIADLNLKEYRIGQQRFVPVPVEVFREPSMFPAEWTKRILVVDSDSISPTCMKGYMPFELGETSEKGKDGSIADYKEWWIQAMLGMKMYNPLGSFYLDLA